jgi:hypothetical protein
MFVVFHFHLLSQYDGTALTLDNERFITIQSGFGVSY